VYNIFIIIELYYNIVYKLLVLVLYIIYIIPIDYLHIILENGLIYVIFKYLYRVFYENKVIKNMLMEIRKLSPPHLKYYYILMKHFIQ